MAKKALNPKETRGRKIKEKDKKASAIEALPVYKEYQDKVLKTVTFAKFRIDATLNFNEARLHTFFKKAGEKGYHFTYKGLHLAGDNIDNTKVKNISYLFTAIELKVPVNFTKEKIVKDLDKSCHIRTVAKIMFDDIYEDVGI